MNRKYSVIDDRRDGEVNRIACAKVNAAINAEMVHNGGNFDAAVKTIIDTFDFKAAEKEARDEYDAQYI